MKKIFPLIILPLLLAFSACAQTANKSESVFEERLSNAEVTKKKMGNGATFTSIRFAGSLQPNHQLGCVSIEEASNAMNPPALLVAVKECVKRAEHLKAWMLMQTATGFAYYDLKRLADKSTQGAFSVATMNTFSDFSDSERTEVAAVFKKFQMDAEKIDFYCKALTQIGHPTYEPKWAILHGIGVFHDPRNGDYLANVDSDKLWGDVLKRRCTVETEK